MLLASIVIAATVAFCDAHAEEPRCTSAPVTAAEIDHGDIRALMNIARHSALRRLYDADGATSADEWDIAGPDDRGDCEDRLLWAAQELRRRHPELANAYRFVALEDERVMRDGRHVRVLHLVLVIERAHGERLVIDTRADRLRHWDDYTGTAAFTPEGALDGRWRPYE